MTVTVSGPSVPSAGKTPWESVPDAPVSSEAAASADGAAVGWAADSGALEDREQPVSAPERTAVDNRIASIFFFIIILLNCILIITIHGLYPARCFCAYIARKSRVTRRETAFFSRSVNSDINFWCAGRAGRQAGRGG